MSRGGEARGQPLHSPTVPPRRPAGWLGGGTKVGGAGEEEEVESGTGKEKRERERVMKSNSEMGKSERRN